MLLKHIPTARRRSNGSLRPLVRQGVKERVFYLIRTPNQSPNRLGLGYRNALIQGPKGWDPWPEIAAWETLRGQRAPVDLGPFDHPHYLQLLNTEGMSDEELRAYATEFLQRFPGLKKIEIAPLPKMVYGQHYPGGDKHPGVVVRSPTKGVDIEWIHDRIHHLLNAATSHYGLQQPGEFRDAATTFKKAAAFFQGHSPEWAFIEFWSSSRFPKKGLEAAKTLAAFVGLDLEILPGTPVEDPSLESPEGSDLEFA